MSLKKQFLKSKPICKVTFELTKEEANDSEKVFLVGEFNNWDKEATPLKKLKKGTFKTTLELETGKEYQFRYLFDNEVWSNEADADKQVPNEFGDSKNSVIIL